MGSWYTENVKGPAVSTRIRLARNLSNFPFSRKMTMAQRKELKSIVKDAVANVQFEQKLNFIDMQTVPQNEINSMVERHIISPQFAQNTSEKAIILSSDESVCVMIGEEDHIRIQVILAGLSLQKALGVAKEIDKQLSEQLSFAYNERLGYLTECPTNLGTGLRASVMLHLPISESTGEMSDFSNAISKIGFTVRGLYGEGTKSQASLYQISNQVTLGITEENAVNSLEKIANQFIEKENRAIETLEKEKLEDITSRAFGTLCFAKILDSNEMMALLSKVKLGQNLGIISSEINPIKLLIEGGPYMIMKKNGDMTPRERDIKRAEDIREYLKSYLNG